jgi:hypothetical protein
MRRDLNQDSQINYKKNFMEKLKRKNRVESVLTDINEYVELNLFVLVTNDLLIQ